MYAMEASVIWLDLLPTTWKYVYFLACASITPTLYKRDYNDNERNDNDHKYNGNNDNDNY